MKKLTIITIALILALAPTGCENGNNGNTNTTPAPPRTESPARVQIDFAADEALSRYESFHEFVHEDKGAWFIIATDKVITDFEFIIVTIDAENDAVVYSLESVVYPAGELTPRRPFKVKTYSSYGTFTLCGISFADTDVKRYFYINESGKDGSLSLVEFDNENQ